MSVAGEHAGTGVPSPNPIWFPIVQIPVFVDKISEQARYKSKTINFNVKEIGMTVIVKIALFTPRLFNNEGENRSKRSRGRS